MLAMMIRPDTALGAMPNSATEPERQPVESPSSQAGYYFQAEPPPPTRATFDSERRRQPIQSPPSQAGYYFGTRPLTPSRAYMPFGPSFGACSLELPSSGPGGDSGLTQMYLESQQGRDWLFAPTLTVREIYSDNVTLAPSGEEESDFITEVIPGFTACDSGPRWQGQLHYELQGLYYAKNPDLNHIYNQVQGSGTAELLRNHLFFDANTFYGQQAIDPTQSFSNDNSLATGNRTNSWTFNLSPYWRQSLGALGLSTLRYRYGRVMYDTGRVPDSYSNTFSFDVISPPTNSTWSWEAYVRSEEVNRSGNNYRTTYFDTASLNLGYQLTPHLRLLAEGGLEDDYLADGGTDRFGSTFWNAGFLWADDRTSLEARYGHRFFGSSYYVKLQHQAARLTTALSYTEEPQVTSRLAIDNPNAVLLPNQPPLIFNPEDQTLTPLENNEVFVRRRFAGTATYETGRSTIHFDAFLERRDFVVSDDDERVRGFDVYWRWQWLPRTALIPRWRWEKIDFQSGQTDYISQQQISLAHLISPTSQAGITLRHQWRNSSRAESEYTENAVILEYTKIF